MNHRNGYGNAVLPNTISAGSAHEPSHFGKPIDHRRSSYSSHEYELLKFKLAMTIV